MSLIAWYPLNGDTLDYSGNTNHLTFHGSSSQIVESSEGKIGKCLERVSINTGAYLKSTNKILLDNNFTMTCWAYVTNTHSMTANGLISLHDYGANSGPGITVGEVNTNDYKMSCSTGNGTSRTYHSYRGTTNIKNKWSHLALRFTKDTETLELLVDGVIEYSSVYSMVCKEEFLGVFVWGTNSMSSASYKPAARLNDIRIYDHALSTKEVKEIAKAKILHYKFDDFQEPTENLMSYDIRERCWDGGSGSVCSIRTKTGSHSMVFKGQSSVISDAGYAYVYPYYDVPNGNYTYSIKARNNNSRESRINLSLREGSNGANLSPSVVTHLQPGETKVISTTTTTPVSTGRITTSLSVYSDSTGYVDIEVTDSQLEKKDHATPFTPNLRDGIVRDCSGYGNDAILDLATTPTWVSDSKIGGGAYYFPSSGDRKIQRLQWTPSDQVTVSFWFKSTSTGKDAYHLPLNIGHSQYEFSITSSGKMLMRLYINNVMTQDTWGNGLLDGKWHMCTLTYDGYVKKFYIDSVLVGHRSTIGTLPGGERIMCIGKFDDTLNYGNSNAYEDDIRIYATALSADDIKELYEQRVSIDDHSNTYVQEVREVGLPVRYIRESMGGSNKNTGNHWCEIQAFDSNDVNVALGKSASSPIITDGVTASSPYYSGGPATVDLGEVSLVNYLKIWHYYADSRIYMNIKTEVSSDNINWITIFDSEIEGRYQETSQGNTVLVTSDKLSIDSKGIMYADEISEITLEEEWGDELFDVDWYKSNSDSVIEHGDYFTAHSSRILNLIPVIESNSKYKVEVTASSVSTMTILRVGYELDSHPTQSEIITGSKKTVSIITHDKGSIELMGFDDQTNIYSISVKKWGNIIFDVDKLNISRERLQINEIIEI